MKVMCVTLIKPNQGLGNSQVLHKDYYKQSDIELVLSEMAEQVAIRCVKLIKRQPVWQYLLASLTLLIIHSCSKKVGPPKIQSARRSCHRSFSFKYNGGAVRNIAVRYNNFVDENMLLYLY